MRSFPRSTLRAEQLKCEDPNGTGLSPKHCSKSSPGGSESRPRDSSFGWLVGRMVGRSEGRSVGGSVGRRVGRLEGRSVGRSDSLMVVYPPADVNTLTQPGSAATAGRQRHTPGRARLGSHLTAGAIWRQQGPGDSRPRREASESGERWGGMRPDGAKREGPVCALPEPPGPPSTVRSPIPR